MDGIVLRLIKVCLDVNPSSNLILWDNVQTQIDCQTNVHFISVGKVASFLKVNSKILFSLTLVLHLVLGCVEWRASGPSGLLLANEDSKVALEDLLFWDSQTWLWSTESCCYSTSIYTVGHTQVMVFLHRTPPPETTSLQLFMLIVFGLFRVGAVCQDLWPDICFLFFLYSISFSPPFCLFFISF